MLAEPGAAEAALQWARLQRLGSRQAAGGCWALKELQAARQTAGWACPEAQP